MRVATAVSPPASPHFASPRIPIAAERRKRKETGNYQHLRAANPTATRTSHEQPQQPTLKVLPPSNPFPHATDSIRSAACSAALQNQLTYRHSSTSIASLYRLRCCCCCLFCIKSFSPSFVDLLSNQGESCILRCNNP